MLCLSPAVRVKTRKASLGPKQRNSRGSQNYFNYHKGKVFAKLPLRNWVPLQKLHLTRGGEDNLKSQLGCFAPQGVDLTLAVARLVKHRASVDELHPVAEHSIHESGQLGCHS